MIYSKPGPTNIEHNLFRQRMTASNNDIADLQTIKTAEMENMNIMTQIKTAPHLNIVINHARRLLRTSNDTTKSTDWTDLQTLAHVCEAVRHFQELQLFQVQLPQN